MDHFDPDQGLSPRRGVDVDKTLLEPFVESIDDLVTQIASGIETIDGVLFDLLRDASQRRLGSAGGEKQLMSARRSLEKASHQLRLLRGPASPTA